MIKLLLYITLSIFCIIDYFQTVALIKVGFTKLNLLVL